MALKVGITGGMGAGKSLVAGIFKVLGIPVYDSDEAAKRLMTSDDHLVTSIKRLLGDQSYLESGALNRQHVANEIFSKKRLAVSLEALVHPAVHADAESWSASHQQFPYTLREAALLFESGSYLSLDIVINVSAPQKLRIQRVVERDGHSIEDVQLRMKRQWTEAQRVQLADFTIMNDGEQMIIPQVWDIHQKLKTFAANF